MLMCEILREWNGWEQFSGKIEKETIFLIPRNTGLEYKRGVLNSRFDFFQNQYCRFPRAA